MKYLFIFIPVIFLLSVSCKKDHNGNSGNSTANSDVAGPAILLDSFPLKTGNTWVYDNGDTIRVVSDTVINGIKAKKLLKTNGTLTAAFYYANLPDGLHEIATNLPQSFDDGMTCPLGPGFEPSDTLDIPDTSLFVAKFPIDTSDTWIGHIKNYNDQPRQWEGFVTVTTPAGKFNCVKLRATNAYEYYSVKGLVKVSEIIECLVAPCPTIDIHLVYVNF